jgi:hypothetical protein
MKLGRNDPCHCGSGNKYKKCHLPQDEAARSAEFAKEAAARQAEAERLAKEEAEKPDAPAAGHGAERPKAAGGGKPSPTKPVATTQLRRRRASV